MTQENGIGRMLTAYYHQCSVFSQWFLWTFLLADADRLERGG